jgi:hypothetical protein
MSRPPFKINLSSHRGVPVGALRIAMLSLSLIFVALFVWDFQRLHEVMADTEFAEQGLTRARDQDSRLQAEARAEGLDLSDAAVEGMAKQVTFANQLIAKRAFSWTHFLGDLEEAVPPRIAINNVRLDAKEYSIALSGAASSLKDLTALIISLEDHPAFEDVALIQHQVQDNALVEFRLTVRYTDSKRPQSATSSPQKTPAGPH